MMYYYILHADASEQILIIQNKHKNFPKIN